MKQIQNGAWTSTRQCLPPTPSPVPNCDGAIVVLQLRCHDDLSELCLFQRRAVCAIAEVPVRTVSLRRQGGCVWVESMGFQMWWDSKLSEL